MAPDGLRFDLFAQALFDFFATAPLQGHGRHVQSLKKLTGRPGVSTRMENTQPDSG